MTGKNIPCGIVKPDNFDETNSINIPDAFFNDGSIDIELKGIMLDMTGRADTFKATTKEFMELYNISEKRAKKFLKTLRDREYMLTYRLPDSDDSGAINIRNVVCVCKISILAYVSRNNLFGLLDERYDQGVITAIRPSNKLYELDSVEEKD